MMAHANLRRIHKLYGWILGLNMIVYQYPRCIVYILAFSSLNRQRLSKESPKDWNLLFSFFSQIGLKPVKPDV